MTNHERTLWERDPARRKRRQELRESQIGTKKERRRVKRLIVEAMNRR